MVQPKIITDAIVTQEPTLLEFDRVGLEYRVDGQPRRIIDEISLSIAQGNLCRLWDRAAAEKLLF